MEVFNPKSYRIGQMLNFASTIRLGLFLLLCFILGGTSQDIVAPKLILYLISLLIIGGCLTTLNAQSRLWNMKSIIFVLGFFLFAHILYIIPLPPEVWSNLPGREFIIRGYQTIGTDLPWLPLSVSPEKSVFSLFDFLPPIAIILMMGTVVRGEEVEFAIKAIGFMAIFSVMLGIMQVANINDQFYPYEITNKGSAVGFFSNANHLGVFLLMSIPIIASLPSALLENDYSNRGLAFGGVCFVAALLGIGVTGSLGSFLLIIPVIAATALIWKSGRRRPSIYFIGILLPLIAAFSFDMFVWENLRGEAFDKITSTHAMDRQTMFANGFDIAKTYLPIGSGPGSFPEVYRLIETPTYKTVPHAHNEYIEIFLEFGFLGLIWIFFGLLWVQKNVWKAFRLGGTNGQISKYFSVAILIVIIHSIFDFSLRTISIMTLFVFCLCVLTLFNQDPDNIQKLE